MSAMDTEREGPGTSSTMRRLEEGRRLPWRMVKHTTWVNLANKLDLPSPVSNNDWKGLAEHLGFSTEDILVLDNSKERSTVALFTNYLPKKNASVNSVAKALKLMNRDDALQILLDAVPEIEARYDAESQNSASEAMEGTDSCVTTMAQRGCSCLASSLTCNTQHGGGGGCSPCHTHPHHHQAAPPPHCSLASGSCCCHHGSLHYHSPPVSCTPHLHHSHARAGRASPLAMSSGCRGAVGGALSTAPLQNYNLSLAGSHQEPPGYKSYASGNKGDFFGSPSSPPPHCVGRSPLQHPQSRSSPLQHHGEGRTPSFSEVMQESMVVHHDLDSQHPADLRSFLPDNTTGMEVDGGDMHEEPALLHTAIGRGQGLVSMSPLNCGAHAPQPLEGPDLGEDTPSTSVEELSSSDSSSRLSGLPLNVVRQVSEECNANQPSLPPMAASPRAPPPLYGRSDNHDAMAPWGIELSGAAAAAPDSHRNLVGAQSGNRGQSSLKELENLSFLPSRFMPGNKFTTMVAEQQMEDAAPNHRGLRVNIKRERDSSRSCQFSGLSSGRSGGGANSKSKGLAGADTYPLRIKPQAGGATVDEVRSRQPGMLMKTTSVPIDMKVEEFRKAFRHIKVFVTYANDSKHHRRQVLSLCNCLDRNGFSCCVDVSPRQDSPEQVQATRDWCGRKFREADFVLVCLSPLYLQEISRTDSQRSAAASSNNNNNNNSNNKGEKNSMHTAYIYQLMQEEFHNTKRCSRFVPLYLEGSSCSSGPGWLTQHLSYRWPQQYKDLLWMLTKPEDRIKQRSRSSPQKGLHVLKDKANGRHGDPVMSSPLN